MSKIHPLEAYRKRHTPPKTKAELARELNVSKTTVNRWEKSIRKIDEGQLGKVSSKTGIPAKDLRPDLFKLISGAN